MLFIIIIVVVVVVAILSFVITGNNQLKFKISNGKYSVELFTKYFDHFILLYGFTCIKG